jgi:hypothetical protein
MVQRREGIDGRAEAARSLLKQLKAIAGPSGCLTLKMPAIFNGVPIALPAGNRMKMPGCRRRTATVKERTSLPASSMDLAPERIFQ